MTGSWKEGCLEISMGQVKEMVFVSLDVSAQATFFFF